MYDIFFISYDEPNADTNYQHLINRFPLAKRVHGIVGILNAHKECARQAITKMFYVVDGDAEISPLFNFDYEAKLEHLNSIHVWRSKNAVNGLVYGYGGVKLLPKQVVLDASAMQTDMTTSLSCDFKIMPQLASITKFNSSPFNAWRGGFRECTKLASKVIDRQKDQETEMRLDTWCMLGEGVPNGIWAVRGAKDGRAYGTENQGNTEALKKINDFNWLKEQFEARYAAD